MHHCAICEKSFCSKRNLEKHLRGDRHHAHVQSQGHTYDCHCGRGFIHISSMYRHRRTCTIRPNNNTQDTMVENSDQVEQQNDPPNEIAELREEIAELREEIAQLRSKNNDVPTAVQRVSSGRRKWKPAEREQIAIKQDNKCNRCQATLSMYFHIDHKTALQYGGLDDAENLQALCYECHIQKSILENRARDRIQDAIHVILNEEATLHHS